VSEEQKNLQHLLALEKEFLLEEGGTPGTALPNPYTGAFQGGKENDE
jgi:hypothetical protein